jgi:putative restriction endonuclease
MHAWVGVTDEDWFRYLKSRPDLDELNFWQPGGNRQFGTLQPGEPFLFKLHSPKDYIVGGGFFTHSALLPTSLAWEAFEAKNGATSLEEMRLRIEKYRRTQPSPDKDYQIGCIILQFPFFFEERDWIPIPADWKKNIVQGKTYELESGLGQDLWRRVQALITTQAVDAAPNHTHVLQVTTAGRYGTPYLATARLGQGSFRILVMDTYHRKCAVTGEKTLPVLQAAHIRPYGKGGEHRLDNGLLLREDLHTLFDRGYVTVKPDYRFAVSRRIRDEFTNGRDYYALDGRQIVVPDEEPLRPNREGLEWHNRIVFKS